MRALFLAALLFPGAAAAAPASRGPAVPLQLAALIERSLSVPSVPEAAPAASLTLPAAASGASRDPRLLVLLERLRALPASPAAERPAALAESPERAAPARAGLDALAAALGPLSAEQIRDMPEAGVAELSSRVWDLALRAPAADPGALGPGGYDPAEGQDEIERLEALNEDLAAGRLSAADLESRGLIRYGSGVVTRGRPGEPGGDQVMPFRELLLPAARTGVYAPTRLGPAKDYQGLLILMPGIGADISTAKTVLDLAVTFSKAKKDAVLDDVDGRRLRLITFPLDATLNGMGRGAPFSFGSARGSAAVLRHAVLVLGLLHPGLPVFVAGRSQGGLIALEYASRHGEAAGVVALNPSHPSPEIVEDTVRTHELAPEAILGAQSFTLDPRIWTAYKHFTPGFETLARSSRSRVLLLLGKNDPSYPQPRYVDSLQDYAQRQAGDRRVALFDLPPGKSHNLWNRHEEGIYREAVREMARFFQSLLP